MYLIKTEVKESPIQGKGYFALEDIPLGTIVYYYSEDDKHFSKPEFNRLDPAKQARLQEFAVEDEFGNWVETATGPYTNHSCDANILPLFIDGQYTSIAVKDIKSGEEITTDYAQFFSSVRWSMQCNCQSKLCRGTVGFGHVEDVKVEHFWQERIAHAVADMRKVDQPLMKSKDKNAQKITAALQSKHNPLVIKHIKYSLISG